jgi:Zn-dependent protease
MARILRFSRHEIKDLVKAWAVISLAFTIVMVGIRFSTDFIMGFFVAALTVGTGFVAHELGHKFVAQHYGCFAEFRAYNNMLLAALIMSFFGFIFAAPGAVMIMGNIDRIRNGRISAAGPFMSLSIASIFLILAFAAPLRVIWIYGFIINSWIALFNLIPVPPFDGGKIYKWNKPAYIGMIIIAATFMFLQYIIR